MEDQNCGLCRQLLPSSLSLRSVTAVSLVVTETFNELRIIGHDGATVFYKSRLRSPINYGNSHQMRIDGSSWMGPNKQHTHLTQDFTPIFERVKYKYYC